MPTLPPIRAMPATALLCPLLGEEAATQLANHSLIEIFALHTGINALREYQNGYGASRVIGATKELMSRALALVDIRVLDHFIVAGTAPPLSFAERGLI